MVTHAQPQSPESSGGKLSRPTVGRGSRWLESSSPVRATGRFFRRRLWTWPLVAALVFGAAGWWVHRTVEHSLREQRAAELNTLVDASVTALRP